MSGIIGGAGSRSGIIGETEIDYEEGNWTPEFYGSSGGTGTTTNNVQALYVRIGRLCHVQCDVTWASISGVSGQAKMRGLPFEPANFAAASIAYIRDTDFLGGTDIQAYAEASSGIGLISFVEVNNNSPLYQLDHSAFDDSNNRIFITCTYRIN